MELAVCAAIVTIFNLLWTFYLHGKVQEKSIAAKTQQIIRDWKLGNKKSWEAEYNGGQPIEACRLVASRQTDLGKWTTWTCACGQTTECLTREVKYKFNAHKKIMKMVAK